jgi:hypothetical protein
MAENRAEQADEIEALESMYPDDFTLVQGVDKAGKKTPRFKISLVPTEPADEEVNHIGCVLEVACPPQYPADGPPELTIHQLHKLTEQQREKLQKIAVDAAEENVGAPVVFVVIEAVREWLQKNNEDPGDGSAFSEMIRRQREVERAGAEAAAADAAAEMEAREEMTDAEIAAARRKAEGTPCTNDTFHAWNKAFIAEMNAARRGVAKVRSMKAGGDSDPEATLTGRQWFEQKILQGEVFDTGAGAEESEEEEEEEEEGGEDGGDGEDDGESGEGGEGGGGGRGKPAAVDVNAAVFLNAPADDELDLNDFSDED